MLFFFEYLYCQGREKYHRVTSERKKERKGYEQMDKFNEMREQETDVYFLLAIDNDKKPTGVSVFISGPRFFLPLAHKESGNAMGKHRSVETGNTRKET